MGYTYIYYSTPRSSSTTAPSPPQQEPLPHPHHSHPPNAYHPRYSHYPDHHPHYPDHQPVSHPHLPGAVVVPPLRVPTSSPPLPSRYQQHERQRQFTATDPCTLTPLNNLHYHSPSEAPTASPPAQNNLHLLCVAADQSCRYSTAAPLTNPDVQAPAQNQPSSLYCYSYPQLHQTLSPPVPSPVPAPQLSTPVPPAPPAPSAPLAPSALPAPSAPLSPSAPSAPPAPPVQPVPPTLPPPPPPLSSAPQTTTALPTTQTVSVGHASAGAPLLPMTQNQAPRNIKGPWRTEEDQLLCSLVQQYGPRRWTFIAMHIPGRTGKQARERWINQLNPELSRVPWTKEEDRIIREAHAKWGNKWCEIAKLLKGRTDNACKNHWNTTIRREMAEQARKRHLANQMKKAVEEEKGRMRGKDVSSACPVAGAKRSLENSADELRQPRKQRRQYFVTV